MKTCVCGDVEDEHGQDPEFPGSSACSIEGCDCVAWEWNEEDEEDIE